MLKTLSVYAVVSTPQKNRAMSNKKAKAADIVLEQLEFDILSGVFRPRERLVESDLLKRYQATRGTIRKILKELEFKQLVRHFPNRGATVAEPTSKEMEDIYKTRILLESYAVDNLPTPLDKSVLAQIATQCNAFADAVAQKDFRRVVAANRLFHHTIFEQCGNLLVLELIDQLRTRSHFWQHYIVGQPDRINRTISEHQTMLSYLEQGDMEALKQVNQTHLTWGFKDYMTDLRPGWVD